MTSSAADLPHSQARGRGTAPGGLIIFLNGTSSSGKSSIARALVGILDEPSFHLSVDAFHAMRSSPELAPEHIPLMLKRTWMGFHRAVAGMAAAQNTVVVDHVLSEPWRLRDCLSLFRPQDVALIKVRCSLPELERRERLRGDRPPGLAARQFPQVHAHGSDDLEVDTDRASPLECARQIREFLGHRPTPTAFERLQPLLGTTAR